MRDALVRLKFVDEKGAERAWQAHQDTHTPLRTVLTELGILTQEKLVSFWARWLDLETLGADDAVPELELAKVLSHSFLQTHQIVPVRADDETVWIATNDPLNGEAFSAIGYMLDRKVVPVCATPRQIASLLGQVASETAVPDNDNAVFSGPAGPAGPLPSDVEHLRALANEGPVVQQVNALFVDAFERGASDIHLEPDAAGLAVRYRIDGQLIEVRHFDHQLQPAIISRLKILGKMDITERRLPQDGRSSVIAGGQKIDLRISSLPTVDGESIVLRLLVQDASKLNWDALGFDADTQAQLERLIRRPSGMFLVTGPTGSGKTTTLYTALGKIDRTRRKVISVEDPVEYRLDGVMQVHVNTDLGLDFATVLRTILRQDPDTIMIGEIRDIETAQIALRASMTGHQVFSTLHTDGAISSINRLADMGVPRYLLGAHINGIMSQRLVRKLCPACREEADHKYQPAGRGIDAGAHPPIRHKVAVGCKACNHTGYSGRTIVCELLILTEELKDHISSGSNWQAIRSAARQMGFKSQFETGLQLIADGVTTVDEVMSLIGPV